MQLKKLHRESNKLPRSGWNQNQARVSLDEKNFDNHEGDDTVETPERATYQLNSKLFYKKMSDLFVPVHHDARSLYACSS